MTFYPCPKKKKPPKCASKRGMGGVLSCISYDLFKATAFCTGSDCKPDADAKLQYFFWLNILIK